MNKPKRHYQEGQQFIFEAERARATIELVAPSISVEGAWLVQITSVSDPKFNDHIGHKFSVDKFHLDQMEDRNAYMDKQDQEALLDLTLALAGNDPRVNAGLEEWFLELQATQTWEGTK